VLVTGHTGFKGSWLSTWLLHLGADVHGLALDPPTDPALFDQLDLEARMTHTAGDIRDLQTVRDAVARCQPEYLFHLAAQSLVRLSYDEPKETFDVNVGGTTNVLEAARACDSLKSMVVVTTDKCYENHEWVYAYRENDAMGGSDPYSASKGCAEILTQAYYRSFFRERGVGVATARAGNVIGGGDHAADRIIPDCVRALSAGKPIFLRNPASTRPWQHVLEPLLGYLVLAAHLRDDPAAFSEGFNFGPAQSSDASVEALARDAIDAWGSGEIEYAPKQEGKHEANALRLASDKANVRLGWRSALTATEAVRMSIEWYRQAADAADADAIWQLTLRQLDEYSKRVGVG
jgi:CDP-glucose 4,6-dehydratase